MNKWTAAKERKAAKELDGLLVWHFLPNDRKLANDDGRIVRAGSKHEVTGKIKLCARGLHGSIRAIDALKYAPGHIIQRAVLYGTVIEGADKAVASHRATLWIANAEETLHLMACWSAEQALGAQRKRGMKVDPRSDAAIKAKRDWLKGKITDAELAAAWDAARGAAWDAAMDAAWAAARAAAWAAAWDAARGAAMDAARGAAMDAAWAAARGAQNARLESMLRKLAP